MITTKCSVCGRDVTPDQVFRITEGGVGHVECLMVNPWAEGDKAAAPASEEQEDGERRTDGTH
jgi:hypothetical protein